MKATRQLVSLCLGIGMLMLFNLSFGQGVSKTKPALMPKAKPAQLTIKFDDLSVNDSLTLSLFQHTLINSSGSSSLSNPATFTSLKNSGGLFHFTTLPLSEPCYINLGYGVDNSSTINKLRFVLLNLYLIEPGDNVNIVVTRDSIYQKNINKRGIKINDGYFGYIYKNGQYTIHFSGNGSAKYSCRYAADRTMSAHDEIFANVIDRDGNLFKDSYFECFKNRSIQILNTYKKGISRLGYEILYTDFSAKYNGDWYKSFSYKWHEWRKGFDMIDKASNFFEKTSVAFYKKRKEEILNVNEDTKRISAWYPYWIIQKEVATAYLNNEFVSARGNEVYEAINKDYKNELRDKILTAYLIDWYIYLNNGQAILKDALAEVSSGYYEKVLEGLQNLQTKGKDAYNFSLTNTEGNVVKLQDFAGKVVFIDFWYTACSNCVAYYKSVLSEVEEEYKNNPDIKFVTINIDINRNTWLKSVASGRYTSSHAINLFTDGSGTDHPVIKHYQVTGYPRPLLIDRSGRIFSAAASELRDREKLKSLLSEALLINSSAGKIN
jgi:cytochrome oxidase Cu insertion factor (SCO1/SenC/PrrC family)